MHGNELCNAREIETTNDCQFLMVFGSSVLAASWFQSLLCLNPLMHNVPKWSDTLLKILKQMLQYF